jgi:hypothetical protein
VRLGQAAALTRCAVRGDRTFVDIVDGIEVELIVLAMLLGTAELIVLAMLVGTA